MNNRWVINNSGNLFGWHKNTSEFKKNKIKNVVRETVQNSIDARSEESQENNTAVRVVFEQLIVNDLEHYLPDYDTFIDHCEKAIDQAFNDKNNNIRMAAKAAEDFLKNAKNGAFKVLKISDSNTVGLDGIIKDESRFDYLINREGSSSLQGRGGGSFGVGKFAPFPYSNIGTVIYSTNNQDDEYGFAIKTILQSYKLKDKDGKDEPFVDDDGTYYKYSSNQWRYFDADGNFGISDKNTIDELGFLKEDKGTDIYVVGTKDVDNDFSFLENFQKEIVENYFVAIKEGLLECAVKENYENGSHKNIEINSENIEQKCDETYELMSKKRNSENYPKTLSKTKCKSSIAIKAFEGEHYELNIKNIGKVDLYIKFSPQKIDEDYITSSHIHRSRLNGQTVHYKSYGNVSSESFIGLMIVRDQEGSNLLSLCEPPRHDDWDVKWIEESNTEDRLRVKEGVDDFDKKLLEIFRKRDGDTDKLQEIPDSRFLPFGDTGEGNKDGSSLRTETGDKETEFIPLDPVKVVDINRIPLTDDEGDDTTGGGKRKRKGKKKIKKKTPRGSGHEDGESITTYIEKNRILWNGDQKYKIVFFSESELDNVELQVNARSEDNFNEILLDIQDAKNSKGDKLEISGSSVKISKISKGRNVIFITIDRHKKLALTLGGRVYGAN
tara:strand:- start:2002 stop:3999 length:1998 start_codon:yes stop_codon:yes gene_type:complete